MLCLCLEFNAHIPIHTELNISLLIKFVQGWNYYTKHKINPSEQLNKIKFYVLGMSKHSSALGSPNPNNILGPLVIKGVMPQRQITSGEQWLNYLCTAVHRGRAWQRQQQNASKCWTCRLKSQPSNMALECWHAALQRWCSPTFILSAPIIVHTPHTHSLSHTCTYFDSRRVRHRHQAASAAAQTTIFKAAALRWLIFGPRWVQAAH